MSRMYCVVLMAWLLLTSLLAAETLSPASDRADLLSAHREVVAGLGVAKTAYQNKDYAVAAQEFASLAAAGDVEAQYFSGLMAESGEGRARDLTLAVSWYSKSAKQGFPLAQYRLGMAYAGGNGVDADPQLAVRWLKPAAQADHIRLGYRRYGIERHMIYFRITTYGIAVVRILHDRMDASRYLSI